MRVSLGGSPPPRTDTHPPATSRTCQPAANVASHLQRCHVASPPSQPLFAIVLQQSFASDQLPVFGWRDLIVSQLNRCADAIFTFCLSLSDNGIRCFSNLDLYLTMCEEIYDETSVKGGGRRSWSPSSRSRLKWWRAHLQRLSQSANQPSIFITHIKSARDRSIKDRITKSGSPCRSKWFHLCNGVCPVRCKSSTKLRLTSCLVETPAPPYFAAWRLSQQKIVLRKSWNRKFLLNAFFFVCFFTKNDKKKSRDYFTSREKHIKSFPISSRSITNSCRYFLSNLQHSWLWLWLRLLASCSRS